MANYPKYNLTGQTPASTYEALVQFNHESSSLVDGNGNDITASLTFSSLIMSSSYALTASYASNSNQITASMITVISSIRMKNITTGNWYLFQISGSIGDESIFITPTT